MSKYYDPKQLPKEPINIIIDSNEEYIGLFNMKVIDLLNKIANREDVPKKFRIKGSCFKDLYYEYNEKYNCYDLIGEKFKYGCYVFGYSELNDEIDIIGDEPKEDKKIEKLSDELTYIKLVDNKTFRKNIVNKINKIIDKVNGEYNE